MFKIVTLNFILLCQVVVVFFNCSRNMFSSESDSEEDVGKQIEKDLRKFKEKYRKNLGDRKRSNSEDDSITVSPKKSSSQKELSTKKDLEQTKVADLSPQQTASEVILPPCEPIQSISRQTNELIIIDNGNVSVKKTSTSCTTGNIKERLNSLLEQCDDFIKQCEKKPQRGRKCKKKSNKKKPNKKVEVQPQVTIEISDKSEDEEDINPKVLINLLWKSFEHKVFMVRKLDKLKIIQDHIAKEYSVDPRLLYFTMDDKRIDIVNSTYISLQLNDDKLVECTVLPEEYANQTVWEEKKKDSGLQFKVQCGSKKHFNVFMNKEDKMDVLFSQILIELNVNLGDFKVLFDGTVVKLTDTFESLELEENDCFDVVYVT